MSVASMSQCYISKIDREQISGSKLWVYGCDEFCSKEYSEVNNASYKLF